MSAVLTPLPQKAVMVTTVVFETGNVVTVKFPEI